MNQVGKRAVRVGIRLVGGEQTQENKLRYANWIWISMRMKIGTASQLFLSLLEIKETAWQDTQLTYGRLIYSSLKNGDLDILHDSLETLILFL